MTATAHAGRVVQTQPLRHPNATSREVMTRRGWWLVLCGFLVPGSAQVLAGNRRLGRIGLAATLVMWVLAVAGVLLSVISPNAVYTIAGSALAMLLLQGVLIVYAVLWIVLALNTLRIVRLVRTGTGARWGIAALALSLTALSSGGALYGANLIGVTRDTLGGIFTASGPAVEPTDGYYNILLLGADSGDGRDSMRFDSISVVSINAETGAVTITGIPRDMKSVRFSEGPMQDLYPNGHEGHADATCGWTSAINQLTTEVELCRADENLYPDAVAAGSTPSIEATKDAAEGTLGIEIPYYVFIDMDHFAALIDALGGVDIDVAQRLPKGGGPAYEDQPAEEWATGWIEAGPQHMDGDTAQWYARSRYTTSDWDRMERQRILQEAILRQFTPSNVLTRFQDVAKAGVDMVETDIPSAMITTLVGLGVKAKEQPMQSIELTPEGVGIDPEDPDFERIHEIVSEVLHPATESPAP